MSPEVWAHRLVLALLAFHVDARAEVLAEIDARGDWREVAEQAAGLAAIAVWDMHSTGRACDTAAAGRGRHHGPQPTHAGDPMSAWQLTGEWRDGIVGELDVIAKRKCGRIERFTVFRFPAGWRCNATNVPQSVRIAALRFARETGL